MENTQIYQKLGVQCNYERRLDRMPHKREAFSLIQKESKSLLRDGSALISVKANLGVRKSLEWGGKLAGG